MKQNFNLFVLFGALLLATSSAGAATVYDNNISALNINMLTDVFMSYTDYGSKMSDFFRHRQIYGSMDRFGEYGDDGSTIKTLHSASRPNKYFINNMWLNANHVNGSMHYGHDISLHNRFNLATIGATTRATHLKRGWISFGGFASYINTKVPDFHHSNGNVVGFFTNYKYRNLDATGLIDTGSQNNTSDTIKFNNTWLNVGANIKGTFKIDDTFLFRPNLYATYTFISSNDLYLNGAQVVSDDYNFFNIAPGVSFVKEVSKGWYGALSAKYVAHFGGKQDINVDGVAINGLYLDNHTDIGLDIEYDYKQFVFTGKIHNQVGGIDGWSTNINVKYVF